MDLLPKDIISFIWGLIVGGVVIVFSGFASELGKDLYTWLKKRLGEPEPLKVSTGYKATAVPPERCSWVVEHETPNFEDMNYHFYPHPKNRNGKCFREVNHRGQMIREFLMVKPENE